MTAVDIDAKIPNNVGLSDDPKLQRALEKWLPKYLEWWHDMGPTDFEDKPIFLSIGYSACHWCHVMEHESFEDEETAAFLNEHFISIKVDREERPDLDQIYMTAVQLLTRQGGWPLSVFLTPDLQPFFGGTYWPPQPMYQPSLITSPRRWRVRS